MIMRSSFPAVTIPDVPVHEHVLAAADTLPDKVALVDAQSGDRMTYAELAASVTALASALESSGLRKGDVVAIFSGNHLLYPVVFHAATAAGLVVSTVSALATPEEASAQLRDCRARWVFAGAAQLDNALAAAADGGADAVITFDPTPGNRSVHDLIHAGGSPRTARIVPSGDVAALPYSSGTTGMPKGVMLTHRNLVANLCQMQPVLEYSADDVLLVVLPFSHIYGLQVLMNLGLAHGATVVIGSRFTPTSYLDEVQRFGVTRAHVAPPMLVALAQDPSLVECRDLSSLRSVFSAAAPLGADLAASTARLLGCPVTQGYGMTELSPASHLGRFADREPVAGSVGVVVPSTEVRLVDPVSGCDGSEGEVWVRGPQVMKGYLNRPDATADLIDEDGWLRTGDIGRVDESGNLFIVDRIKDLIKYKGYQVAPAELEALVLSHPGVADAAVVGVLRDAEEIPKAFVVPMAGWDLAPAEIAEYVAVRVAPYKQLREIEFVAEIPKSPSGKILRRQLREVRSSVGSPVAVSASRS
ncbi:MAG TPA: AMP-binding protein [Marmoricola sp.]|nr:AMP-binding protein [Marmoricola sp.]